MPAPALKPRKNYCIIVGSLLIKVAAVQPITPGIKVIRGNRIQRGVPPAEALALVRSGSYIGKVTAKGRLLQITEVDPRIFVVDFTYWDGRAITRFTTDLSNIPERVKRRETVQLWERLLALDPPPRSWRCSHVRGE